MADTATSTMRTASSARPCRDRRGAVLVVAIVCVAVASILMVAIAQSLAAGRKTTQAGSWQLQAAWLAQSGLERAAWRLAADADYQGETWAIPPDQLPGHTGAVVLIEVTPIADQPDRRLVRVRADYPDHSRHRARQTTWVIVDSRQ